MVTVVGTFQNGYVKLDKDYISKNPVKVLITFLEEIPNQSDSELRLSDFSFSKSQKNLKGFKGSLSETVIDERRQQQ